MTAGRPGRGRVPAGPAELPPRGVAGEAERAAVLADVLSGIELGAWDRRVLAWLAGWDACTVLTVASWVARSRAAGPGR